MMHTWGWIGWIIWLAIGLLFIWAIIRLVAQKPRADNEAYNDPHQSAEEILKKRYASGEITEKEYREIKSSL